GNIAVGGEVHICVELKADVSVLGGADGEYTNYLQVISALNSSVSDTIKTTTRVDIFYRADIGVRNEGEVDYLDMTITSTDGTEQTKTRTTSSGGTVSYFIRVENDGNLSDTFSLTGTGGNSDWEIRYYDDAGEITAAMIGDGYLYGPVSPLVVAPTHFKVVRVEVKALTNTLLAGLTLFVTATSENSPAGAGDTVRTITIVHPEYQPDVLVRQDEPSYIGQDYYTPDPATQSLSLKGVANTQTITYSVRIENDGKNNDVFTITGSGSGYGSGGAGSGFWTVSYYDESGDVTPAFVGAGYSVSLVSTTGFAEITATVTAGADVKAHDVSNPNIFTLRVRGVSAGDSSSDEVQTQTRVEKVFKPDGFIRKGTEPDEVASYVSGNVYSVDGSQYKEQTTDKSLTVTYYVRVQNDGNFADSFLLSGTGTSFVGSGWWIVSYYDQAGENITAAVVDGVCNTSLLPPFQSGLDGLMYKVLVTPDSSVVNAPPTQFDAFITITSVSNNTVYDIVRAGTICAGYQGDVLISELPDSGFVGDTLYNLDGTNQTITRTGNNAEMLIYYVKIQNDAGGLPDSFSITASTSILPGTDWTVSFYDAQSAGTDITSQITSQNGWYDASKLNLNPLQEYTFRIEVTPSATLTGGNSVAVLVTATSRQGDVKDAVKAISVLNNVYSTNNSVRTATTTYHTSYASQNVPAYGSSSAGQSRAVTYYLKIENSGNMVDSFTVTASAAPANWSVSYYEVSGGEITSDVVGTSGWVVSNLSVFSYVEIYSVLLPMLSVAPDTVITTYCRTRSLVGGSEDTVSMQTTVARTGWPDVHIRRYDGTYTGLNNYSETEPYQTSFPVVGIEIGEITTYYIRIENDGNSLSVYTITASASEGGWTLTYYEFDGISWNDITGFISAGNYTTDNIAPGDSREVMVLLSHDGTPTPGITYHHYIRAKAQDDASQTDTVRTATTTPDYTVDSVVSIPPFWVDEGDNLYNGTGVNQTNDILCSAPLSTVTYTVKIQNDGTKETGVTITASPSGQGWIVKYYDVTGGSGEIPYSQITGAGWLITSLAQAAIYEVRAEVSSTITVLGGQGGEKSFYLKSISVQNPVLSDTVRVRNQTSVYYGTDLSIKKSMEGDSAYLDRTLTSTDGTGQTKEQSIYTGGVVSYYIRIENRGNASDTFSITGTGSDADWTVSYYDGAMDITSAVVGQGYPAGPILPTNYSPNACKLLRFEVMPVTTTSNAEYTVLVSGASSGSGGVVKDVVKAVIRTLQLYQTDLMVKEKDDSEWWSGSMDFYTITPSLQSLPLCMVNNLPPAGRTLTYYIKIENKGLYDDTVRITGTGSGVPPAPTGTGSFTVTYYGPLEPDLSGGNDITTQVVDGTPEPYDVWLSGTGVLSYIRVEVTASADARGHDPSASNIFTVKVRGSSLNDVNIIDELQTQSAVNKQFRPDAFIKSQPMTTTDYLFHYVGYDVYSTNDSQMGIQYVSRGGTVTYYVRSQNDGNYSDTHIISGTPSSVDFGGGIWTITYYRGAANITAQVVGGNYTTPVLSPFQTGTTGQLFRVEITPSVDVAQGTVLDVYLKAKSQGDGSTSDWVVARTRVSSYQPDLLIRRSTEGWNTVRDDNVYEADALTQVTGVHNIDSAEIITYYLKIENDGNVADRITVTGTISGDGWTISYYYEGGEVAVGSADGWCTPVISGTGYIEICLRAVADDSVKDTNKEILISSRSSYSDVLKQDAVRALLHVNATYQPDMMLTSTAEAGFVGNDIHNTDGSGQTLTVVVDNNQTLTYYLKLQNDGDTADKFTLTASAGTAGWVVSYYDVDEDITGQLTSSEGWYNPAKLDLAVFAEYTIRVAVTPGPTIAGDVEQSLFITAISQGSSLKKDTVKATTQVRRDYKVDALVKGVTSYDTAAVSQSANNLQVITYYLRIENTGNFANTVTVSGTAGDGDWVVSYYADALEITDHVVAGIYQIVNIPAFSTNSVEFRVEVKPKASALGTSSKQLSISTRAINAPNPSDSVTARTTVNNSYTVDGWIKGMTGYDTAQVLQLVNNNEVVIYYVKIENTGNAVNTVTVSGTGSDEQWTVSYYSATDITAEILDGSQLISIPAFSSSEIRVEVKPKSTLTGSSQKILTIQTRSVDDPTRSDSVTAIVTTNNYTIDVLIGLTTTAYDTSSAFSSTSNNQVAIYYIRIDNNGNMPNTVTVSGTAGDSDWFVTYYDSPIGGNNISTDIASGSWTSPLITVSGQKEIRAVVEPKEWVSGSVQKVLTIIAQSTALPNPSDTVTATTTTTVRYQVDTQIARAGDLPSYSGNGIYEPITPSSEQTKTDNIWNNETLTYYIKLENDGNLPDIFSAVVAGITSLGSPLSDWSISFYDGATDITSQIDAKTWVTPLLEWSESRDIRVEITAGESVTGGSTLEVVLGGSSTQGSSDDTVRISLSCRDRNQPDVKVSENAITYTGENVYDPPTSQIMTKVINQSATISYYVSIQNDGNRTDTFTITGTAGTQGWWTITYYEGATNRTALITSSGWVTSIARDAEKQLIVHISAPITPDKTNNIYLYATSSSDASKKDSVRFVISTTAVTAGLPATTTDVTTGLVITSTQMNPDGTFDPIPVVNLEGKTVGTRPVIIGKTKEFNKTVTLVDIDGRIVGSGKSDDEGYYRIQVTVDLPVTKAENALTPWVGNARKDIDLNAKQGATVNIIVDANPSEDKVPVLNTIATADGTIKPVSAAMTATPIITPTDGRITITGKAKFGTKVIAQIASKLDLNIGSATANLNRVGDIAEYQLVTKDPLPRGDHTLTVVADGVVSDLIPIMFVDPAGVVFDSITGEVIQGAV
ncbi:MAG: hypothetical protein QME51_00625, partial [Planctomycetota bacterium]|nr:hypothetical protein [Planctomycetota bacterium]